MKEWTKTEDKALPALGGYVRTVTEDKAVDVAVVSTNGVGINDGHG